MILGFYQFDRCAYWTRSLMKLIIDADLITKSEGLIQGSYSSHATTAIVVKRTANSVIGGSAWVGQGAWNKRKGR